MSMGCEEYGEAVSAFLDGEVSSAEAAAVDAHLATCVACRLGATRAAAINRLVAVCLAQPAPDIAALVLLRAGGRVSADEHDADVPMRPSPDLDFTQPDADAYATTEVVHDRAGMRCPSGRTTLYLVGVADCGCATTCSCGCQHGEPCRCGARVA